MDRDGVNVHEHAKKERGQCPAISSNQAWSDLLYYGRQNTISYGTKQVIPSGQDSIILPSWVTNHSLGFDSSCPLKSYRIIIIFLSLLHTVAISTQPYQSLHMFFYASYDSYQL